MQVESRQLSLPGFDDPVPGLAPIDICRQVFRVVRPRTPLPEITVEFCRFANANSFIQSKDGRLAFRITDALQSAPSQVLESLACILICKLFRKPVPAEQRERYNLYLNQQDVRRDLHLLRQTRGRKHISGPQGERFNLQEIFNETNEKFFGGLLAQPALGWSMHVSKTILGHFDPSHNAIIISRLLDKPNAPRLAVEYVMYHEMLHVRYPIETKGSRRRIHPKIFRDAEKLFPQLKEAKLALDQLCGSARRQDFW